MNDKNPEVPNVSSLPPKHSFRNPLARETDPNHVDSSKLQTIKSKAKTIAAVVGIASVAVVVAGAVAKKKTGASEVSVTLPEVGVTTDA